MNKKRVVKIILGVVIVLVLMFLIYAIRNFSIINSMINKSNEYQSKTNYYMKVSRDDSNLEYIEEYNKDNQRKIIVKKKEDGSIMTQHMKDDASKVFCDMNDGRKFMYETTEPIFPNIRIEFNNDTTYNVIKDSIFAKIKTEKIDDKDYYAINDLKNLRGFSDENVKNIYYFNKETGLIELVKTINKDNSQAITTYEYKFEGVEDKDFELPNVLEYTINK